MNVLQTGANVAVTQLKSNNRDEGQLIFFFFLLCCSVQETGQSFKASSFLTLTQSERERRRRRRRKKCPSPTFTQEIHHSVFCMWTKRFQERETIVSRVQYAVAPKPVLTLFDIPRRRPCLVGTSTSVFNVFKALVYLCMCSSPCYLFIRTFCFPTIRCAVLEPGTCMLQQDVGSVLTRLISCGRRHRLIKIIPCYRGCFGQPNDTGGLLCSTDCSRFGERRSSTTAST